MYTHVEKKKYSFCILFLRVPEGYEMNTTNTKRIRIHFVFFFGKKKEYKTDTQISSHYERFIKFKKRGCIQKNTGFYGA